MSAACRKLSSQNGCTVDTSGEEKQGRPKETWRQTVEKDQRNDPRDSLHSHSRHSRMEVSCYRPTRQTAQRGLTNWLNPRWRIVTRNSCPNSLGRNNKNKTKTHSAWKIENKRGRVYLQKGLPHTHVHVRLTCHFASKMCTSCRTKLRVTGTIW